MSRIATNIGAAYRAAFANNQDRASGLKSSVTVISTIEVALPQYKRR